MVGAVAGAVGCIALTSAIMSAIDVFSPCIDLNSSNILLGSFCCTARSNAFLNTWLIVSAMAAGIWSLWAAGPAPWAPGPAAVVFEEPLAQIFGERRVQNGDVGALLVDLAEVDFGFQPVTVELRAGMVGPVADELFKSGYGDLFRSPSF